MKRIQAEVVKQLNGCLSSAATTNTRTTIMKSQVSKILTMRANIKNLKILHENKVVTTVLKSVLISGTNGFPTHVKFLDCNTCKVLNNEAVGRIFPFIRLRKNATANFALVFQWTDFIFSNDKDGEAPFYIFQR